MYGKSHKKNVFLREKIKKLVPNGVVMPLIPNTLPQNIPIMSNTEMALARQIINNTHTHLFLTGKAGTGKTTFLRRLREESHKRMVVLAPTGIAAINAGGMTIHSFLQIPPGPYIPGSPLSRDRFRMAERKKRLIRSLDLVVIDEISMVRADLLDNIDAVLRLYRNSSQPFGGVQLLMIGDLQQLPPVIRDEEMSLLAPYYSTPFFFAAHALRHTDFVTIELKTVYRQSDPEFLALLNAVRTNRADAEVLRRLNNRYLPNFEPRREEGYVRLVTHNYQADRINDRELDALPSQMFTYTADVRDNFPEMLYPAAEHLQLKVGAQVMFIKNDSSGQQRYYNGLLGEVMMLTKGSIEVRIQETGEHIEVNREQWTNTRYALNENTKEIEEIVEGTFEQYPLRTAWAITIHKSQGLTFERAIIDAGGSFAHGQTYVALSRCKTLEGMVLSATLSPHSIIQDGTVLSFTETMDRQAPTPESVSQMERAFYLHLIDELFGFTPLAHAFDAFVRLLDEHYYKQQPATLADAKQHRAVFSEKVENIAQRFRSQYEPLTLTSPDYLTDPLLNERIMKGAAYFVEQVAPIAKWLLHVSLSSNNKVISKRTTLIVDELKEQFRLLLTPLRYVAEKGFDRDEYQRVRALTALGEAEKIKEKATRSTQKRASNKEVMPEALDTPKGKSDLSAIEEATGLSALEAPTQKKGKAAKEPKAPKTPTAEISFQLYQAGKLPDEIAAERKLAVSTIYGHLARYVNEGKIPLTDLVPAHHVARILGYLSENPNALTLTEIRNAVGDDLDFGEVRAVWDHFRSTRKEE